MKNISILISFFICSLIGHSQVILKTRPVQVALSHNPVLIIETPLSKQFSFEADLKYQHRKWQKNGGEWDFGRLHNSDGYRISVGTKYYFKTKTYKSSQSDEPIAPFGLYVGGYFSHGYIKTYAIENYTFRRAYLFTETLEELYFGCNFRFGYQLSIADRLALDIYGGFTQKIYSRLDSKIIESIEPDEINTTSTKLDSRYGYFMPHFAFCFGYQLKKS